MHAQALWDGCKRRYGSLEARDGTFMGRCRGFGVVESAEWVAGGPEAASCFIRSGQACTNWARPAAAWNGGAAVEDIAYGLARNDHCNSDPMLLPGQVDSNI